MPCLPRRELCKQRFIVGFCTSKKTSTKATLYAEYGVKVETYTLETSHIQNQTGNIRVRELKYFVNPVLHTT